MRRVPDRPRGFALAACAALAAALACAPPRDAGAAGRAVLRIGWAGSPDSLNPGTGVLAESFTLYGLVYDAMFGLELDHSFSPQLAERWWSSDDGLTWTFRLRPGLLFHDGVPLTAHDVAFSWNLYHQHTDFPFLNSYTEAFVGAEALDDRTAVLHLTHPLASLESQLVFLYILPRHVWASHAADAAAFDNAAMIGSGPFRLLEHRPGEFVRLGAFREHAVSPPRVDEAALITYGTLDALVQALRTGELDMVTELPATAIAALRRDPRVVVASGAPLTPAVNDIKLNQLDPARCPAGGVCSGHPALRDVRVRRALAHATPKREIIDVVLLGEGVPGKTLIADGLGDFYDAELEDYAYDLDAARRLLDEAGCLDRDGDGVRESPDGRPLEFRFDFPSDSPAAPRAAELVARSWARIGVRALRRAVDPSALAAARTPAFDYDVILWSWDSDPDPGYLLSVMTGDQIDTGGNDTGYSNPEYDELYRLQARETDHAARRGIVHRMQRLALRDAVYIVPYYARSVEAFRRDRFHGWRTDERALFLEDRSSLTVVAPGGAP